MPERQTLAASTTFEDVRCENTARKRRRWAEARIAIWDTLNTQKAVPPHIAALADDAIASGDCLLGQASLRLLGAFGAPPRLTGRRAHIIRQALRPVWRLPWISILASEWPIFELLSMHARSAEQNSSSIDMQCSPDIEELLDDLDSKMTTEGYIPVRERYRLAMLHYSLATSNPRCELGELLPVAAWTASLHCHARRSVRIRNAVQSAVERMQRTQDPLLYLRMARYAGVFFRLLQRSGGAFLTPIRASLSVSYDPLETQMHARGIDIFTRHVFNSTDFEVTPGVPCASIWVARDQFPPYGYKGLSLYVDQEAGLSTGRQVGTLEHLHNNAVLYLGIQNPMTTTQCAEGTRTSSYAGRDLDRLLVCVHVQSMEPNTLRTVSPGVLLPFASSSFAERSRYTPVDLSVDTRSWTDVLTRRGKVGYLASTCVAHRERLFDLLVELLGSGVEAIGECSGTHPEYNIGRESTRRSAGFMDDAVELMRDYKFVIAFENKYVDGYLTEKIVNAFLAGAIPIYWGSEIVLQIFNSDAFIFANSFMEAPTSRPLDGLEHVAAEIGRILKKPVLLQRIAAAPVISKANLARWFSWHQSAASVAVAAGVSSLSSILQKQVLVRLGGRTSIEEFCDDSGDERLCTRHVSVTT